MARLRKPESAIDRLVFMKQAEITAKTDQAQNGSYLSADILERVVAFIPKLESGIGDLGKYKGQSQKEIREKNQAISILKVYVRDLWETLCRRVYRENQALDVFAYYQLPKSGNNPILTSDGQWLEMAQLLIEGDASAVAAGYPSAVNPGVAELQEKLDVARAEYNDVSDADRQLDQAQEAVSDIMPEAKQLIDRIIAELEFKLYDKDDASKRRIMRSYGVRYELTKNEQPEDETDYLLNN